MQLSSQIPLQNTISITIVGLNLGVVSMLEDSSYSLYSYTLKQHAVSLQTDSWKHSNKKGRIVTSWFVQILTVYEV